MSSLRPSSDPGYVCSPAYNDSAWRLVDVPHDFIVEGNFTPDADRGHGYLPFKSAGIASTLMWTRRLRAASSASSSTGSTAPVPFGCECLQAYRGS